VSAPRPTSLLASNGECNVNIKIYKIISLLVVLYACAIWSLTLREEHEMEGEAECRREYLDLRQEVTGGFRDRC
jgi:hypothetical protein